MGAETHIDGYANAIRSVVPPSIMEEAGKIVKAHRPAGLPPDFQPVNMARVLLVEDTPSWLGIYSRWADKASHEVATATSPEEATKLIEEGSFDLIITDGLEDEWTKVHTAAQGKGIRTVVVSGSMSVEKEAKERGVEFVDKLDPEWDDQVKGILGIGK